MSLIKLIRKYLFLSILAVLLTGCVSHFLIFRFFIHYSSEQMLRDQKAKIENYIALHDTLPLAPTLVLKPARIEEEQLGESQVFPDEQFKDTVMYSEETGTFIPYRQLSFTASYKNRHSLIRLIQPTVIPNDLLYAIVSSLLVLLVIFVLFTYIIEHLLKKNIWKPLDYNLRRLLGYDLRANTELELKDSGIKEFDEINEVIRRMVGKINRDYENSRLFTEDASHEMQTPLSVIKSKVDLLMQKPSFMQDKENEQAVKALSRAASRLSKLNKSLLLITRINNDQYAEKETIQLHTLLELFLVDLEELFMAKNLTLRTNIKACSIFMNPTLADILLSNLLSNALRYNVLNGWIDITLDNSQLKICNACEEVTTKPANLFNRITFHHKTEESLGLGLNIVKSICDKNEFSIQYDYPQTDQFRIVISFLS